LQEERDEAFSYSFTHTVAHPMVRDNRSRLRTLIWHLCKDAETSCPVSVGKTESTMKLIYEAAEPEPVLHLLPMILHLNHAIVTLMVTQASSVLILGQGSILKDLALDTVFELLALAGTGGTLLAMPSRKAFLASALVTPTVPPSRAYLTLTLPVGGDAVADEGAALARRVAGDPPLLVAATLSTVAFSMARAEESVVPVAAEVIALTVLT